MKRSTTLFLPILLVAASCGTPAQYSQQRFPDSIYTRAGEEPEIVRLYTEEDFENMAAENIARKHGRDTLVVILDDPWDYSWYSRYSHFYYSPWYASGIGFGSYFWNRWRFGTWNDPWFYDPWYVGYGYGWYGGYYDPWYSFWDPYGMYYDPWYYGYGYGYGWYGHRYGWYDNPYYPGGYWGGGGMAPGFGRSVVHTPRSTTTAGGSRERRPGSGPNYRYGTPGSSGASTVGGGNSRVQPRSSSSAGSGTAGRSSSTTNRSREQGYNPSRTYQNSRSGSSTSTRSSSSSSSSSSSRSSSSSSSSRSSGSYSGGSSSSSRSSGGGFSGGGGGGYSGGSGGGSSSHSGGGGGGSSHSGGGRR